MNEPKSKKVFIVRCKSFCIKENILYIRSNDTLKINFSIFDVDMPIEVIRASHNIAHEGSLKIFKRL